LWDVHYADEIEEWNNRHEKVVTGTPSPHLKHPTSYFKWYYEKYNPFIVVDPRTQQGNPSTSSTREFTPDPSPIYTTSQNEPTYHPQFNIPQHQTYIHTTQNQPPIEPTQYESDYHSFQTPHQFPIFDSQTYISPTTQNYHPFNNQTTHNQNYHYTHPDTSTPDQWINQLLTSEDQHLIDRFLSSTGGVFPGATSGLFPVATSGYCAGATSGISLDTTSTLATHVSIENEPIEDEQRGRDGPRRGSRIRQPPGCGTDGHLDPNEVEDAGRGRGRGRHGHGHGNRGRGRGDGQGHVGH
jgi:hypothetical protein